MSSDTNPKDFIRIDGKEVSQKVQEQIRLDVESFRSESGIQPGLAVILVGEDPASQIYVRKKQEACERCGIHSEKVTLPDSISMDELLEKIDQFNQDPKIHGILVQLPLPSHMDEEKVLDRISAQKDVDGFHAENVGLLSIGKPRFISCTPFGVMKLLEAYDIPVAGQHAVIVGRSNIVGKPMAMLLLQANATVTICHSRTKNLEEHLQKADIVVAAVGRPEMIDGTHLKPGCCVIDVGINRNADKKLVGDVAFESASRVARWITPVPGGVGPMTISMLLQNTLESARRRAQSLKGNNS